MKLWLAILLAFQAAVGFSQNGPELPVRFVAIEVYVDTGATPLAAYQLEFKANGGDVKIVGVEGGEPAPFKEAPYYDPKAMQWERVIIAAFSTQAETKLPRGKSRVATIHLQVTGDRKPDYQVKLAVAANSTGGKIAAEATVEERKQP